LTGRALLILPCNKCVRLGDYSLCPNWRVVLKHAGSLVESGALDLAAVDSCKPGIVLWGEEGDLRWCDRNPRWDRVYGRDPVRLELLAGAVARDLRWLAVEYRLLAFYVNVKAYRLALKMASEAAGVELLDLGPPRPSPLSYNKHAKGLLVALQRLVEEAGLKAWCEPCEPAGPRGCWSDRISRA
jgi:hypothetical protein